MLTDDDRAALPGLVERSTQWGVPWEAEGREVVAYSDHAECCGQGVYRTGGEMECCGTPERITDRDVVAKVPNEALATLIALAPALARDWLRLREENEELQRHCGRLNAAWAKAEAQLEQIWGEHAQAALAAHDAARDGAGEEG